MQDNNNETYLNLIKKWLPNSKDFKNEHVIKYINGLLNNLNDYKVNNKTSISSKQQFLIEEFKNNLSNARLNFEQIIKLINQEEFINNIQETLKNKIIELQDEYNKIKEKVSENKDEIIHDNMQYINIGSRHNNQEKNTWHSLCFFNSLKEAILFSNNKYDYRLIIQPKPTWINHEDLWNSGFGYLWDKAIEEPKNKFIIIIHNYNIALADLYGQYLWYLCNRYIQEMPLSKYKYGRIPSNIAIYIVPVEGNTELALEVSKFVKDTIKNEFKNGAPPNDA
ncbi:MAG TPA: hypothetical protein H9804_10700 [Candidatus Mucispirillum faecigallinarum]|uniref:Uncharacterized protein n=1 Tax=Candidatus Mucispirillum faecigallinarum TaxID=2838699 RepID=A0A9D2GWP4_9BACT|nr:hypothetical protein [Candidatus Mucispirillum faecigallinarum]